MALLGHLEPAESAAQTEDTQDAPAAGRRALLGYMGGAIAAFMAAAAGLPMIGYLAGPLASKASAAWLSLGRAATFTAGEPKLVSVTVTRQDGWRRVTESRAVWVKADGAGEFTILNGRCTHLGCAYSWRTDGRFAGKFYCPCHDGLYDEDGSVLSGPPPRALDRLQSQLVGDELFVLYRDFRLGVPNIEPV
jgi:menaquinol-cytochrome c reductase iron-sulfur subunit